LYATSVDKIVEWNKLGTEKPKVGEKITILVPKNFELPKIERLGLLARLPEGGLKTILAVRPEQNNKVPDQVKTEDFLYHTTSRLESIFDIAAKYKIAPEAILKLNELPNTKVFKPGVKLKIKKL
jgi:LysM repeat protein